MIEPTKHEIFNALEIGLYALIELNEERVAKGMNPSNKIISRINQIRDVQTRLTPRVFNNPSKPWTPPPQTGEK